MVKEDFGGRLNEKCDVCDAADTAKEHPASLLTDHNNPQNLTCWMSQPTTDYPNNVTLTLSLGKKYELTYVSLQFCNQRPDSMGIYRSTDFGRTWTPYQFYSSDCEKMYGRRPNVAISRHNEQEALCSDAHANNPLRGDRVRGTTEEHLQVIVSPSPHSKAGRLRSTSTTAPCYKTG
jgi:netrin receptor unc-5